MVRQIVEASPGINTSELRLQLGADKNKEGKAKAHAIDRGWVHKVQEGKSQLHYPGSAPGTKIVVDQ